MLVLILFLNLNYIHIRQPPFIIKIPDYMRTACLPSCELPCCSYSFPWHFSSFKRLVLKSKSFVISNLFYVTGTVTILEQIMEPFIFWTFLSSAIFSQKLGILPYACFTSVPKKAFFFKPVLSPAFPSLFQINLLIRLSKFHYSRFHNKSLLFWQHFKSILPG